MYFHSIGNALLGLLLLVSYIMNVGHYNHH